MGDLNHGLTNAGAIRARISIIAGSPAGIITAVCVADAHVPSDVGEELTGLGAMLDGVGGPRAALVVGAVAEIERVHAKPMTLFRDGVVVVLWQVSRPSVRIGLSGDCNLRTYVAYVDSTCIIAVDAAAGMGLDGAIAARGHEAAGALGEVSLGAAAEDAAELALRAVRGRLPTTAERCAVVNVHCRHLGLVVWVDCVDLIHDLLSTS
jgi:hypothetical protein